MMQIIIVVDHGQVVAFFHEVVPSESDIGIGEEVRYVRHPVLISQIRHRLSSKSDRHIITYVHIRDVTTDRKPLRERIT